MNGKGLIRINTCGYELIEPLGQGGFGTVFRASQQSTGQIVAVKMIHLGDISEQERSRRIDRFERETHLCAELHHPNIVRLLDKCRTEDHHLFAVFEYVPGETLKEVLSREGAFPALKTWELMGQVLDGLSCAHDRGIVHRDLKPANVMITHTGTKQHVKILDFGISTLVPDARKSNYQSLTLTSEAVGTPSYSAPEQLRGEPPTVKSDLYAWGLVLVECLTGQAVMGGATLAEIFHRQLSPADVPLPPAILGHPLGDLLRRVLQKNHKNRTGKTDQLYSDFQKLNLTGIVGKLNDTRTDTRAPGDHIEMTEIVSPWSDLQIERRQITVLCCSLGLMPVAEEAEPDFETLDALQQDLLSLCTDIGARFGGYAAGSLGDSVMIFFGYPKAGDRDARHAARTALEIAGQMRRRSVFLTERQGIRPAFRIGIHSGMVTTCEGSPPSGMTPNTAQKLQNLASAGTVLVSGSTRKLLERYIEFEPSESYPLDRLKPEQTFLLTGERQAEAFSFLQTGSVNLPMVGRDKEFDALKAIWEKTVDQRGFTVLLRGDPGIGKSCLTFKMMRFITDRGHGAIVCRCLPELRNSGLAPILEMLKSQLHLHEASSPDEALCRLESVLKRCRCRVDWSMPILCSWFSMPLPEGFSPVPHSPERQKKILFGVLEELIMNMAHDRPLMIIAEDLHWADQVTLDLLDRLMARIDEARVLILLTARPEFSVPWETENLNIFELTGISLADTESMLRKLTAERPVHRGVLDVVYKRTDGVPLFIEEMVRWMLDREHMVVQNGVYHMQEWFDPASVPITLQDLMNEKLGHLGPAKETAQTAAAIGREFDYSLLVRVSLRDEASVQTDLDEMTVAGVVYRQRKVHGESFIFRHAMIRDSAYNSMVRSVRRHTHGRIAMTMENDFPEQAKADSAGIARHSAEAGMFEKAVRYGTRAATTSLERALNDETIFHSNKVLKWIDRLEADNRDEAELNINGILIQALMGKFGWAAPEVKSRIDRSQNLIERLAQNTNQFRELWALATYHHVAGNRHEVRALTDELARIVEQSGDQSQDVATATFLGLRYQTDGQYTQALVALEKAINLYEPDLNKNHGMTFGLDTRVWAAGTLSIVYWFAGYDTVAVECGENAIIWGRRLNHVPSLAIALLYRGLGHYHSGNKKGAAYVTKELLHLAKKYGLPAYEGYATVLNSWATGNATLATNILDTLQTMGCRLALSLYGAMIASIEAENGNIDTAIIQIDKCISAADEIGEYLHTPVLYKCRAMYLLKKYQEGLPDIKESLMRSAELARAQGMLRTEAEAMVEYSRWFGLDDKSKKRLAEINILRPEIGLEPV